MIHRVVKVLSPELVVLNTTGGGEQLWSARSMRKEARCSHCRLPIAEKKHAFAPVGDGSNRYERICAICIADAMRAS